MKKYHDLKTVYIDCVAVQYFYTRDKNDVNGNPRFRVYIIDPETPTVYETIIKTYGPLDNAVIRFITEAGKQ